VQLTNIDIIITNTNPKTRPFTFLDIFRTYPFFFLLCECTKN
jgi:hypothetical protein